MKYWILYGQWIICDYIKDTLQYQRGGYHVAERNIPGYNKNNIKERVSRKSMEV